MLPVIPRNYRDRAAECEREATSVAGDRHRKALRHAAVVYRDIPANDMRSLPALQVVSPAQQIARDELELASSLAAARMSSLFDDKGARR